MTVFVFKPTNAFVGKFEIPRLDYIRAGLVRFLFTHPLTAYDYLECSNRVWTLVPTENGLELQEGRVHGTQKPETATPPIAAATHCHIFSQGQQRGPYTPQQIESMWSAGTLTADTLVFPDGFSDWIPIGGFLARVRSQHRAASSAPSSLRSAGVLLIIVGVAVTIYFAAIYDTSVQTESRYISGYGTVGGGSVVNLARQQNRLIGVIVGIALSISGVAVCFIPSRPNDA